ncbi:MAG: polyprenyl synthetase family protein [Phycisphaerae bacterium]|nr:polyprenyl synthetase family protein [Phycisphaerae bacterium]
MQNVQSKESEVAARGSSGNEDFKTWLARSRARVEEALTAHLKQISKVAGTNSRLPEAVLYSVRVGGKRLRPILVLECCRVCGEQPDKAMPAALAMELIHTFSLIHDDLPAMDDDDLRRGKPTNHKVFGEALAILAGDWLLAHAFSLLASGGYENKTVPALLEILADGTKRMIEGQGADIAGEGQPADGELVQYIHRHKTAALIETCCRLGAICAAASTELTDALTHYGHHLGLAFQIADDRLDATGSQEKMGKRVGKDADVAKQTYPAAFGLEESAAQAAREMEAALRALEPFGRQAEHLRSLARYVIQRDS